MRPAVCRVHPFNRRLLAREKPDGCWRVRSRMRGSHVAFLMRAAAPSSTGGRAGRRMALRAGGNAGYAVFASLGVLMHALRSRSRRLFARHLSPSCHWAPASRMADVCLCLGISAPGLGRAMDWFADGEAGPWLLVRPNGLDHTASLPRLAVCRSCTSRLGQQCTCPDRSFTEDGDNASRWETCPCRKGSVH